MPDAQPSPEKILQLISGYWASSILSAAATHGLFNHLEQGVSPRDLAGQAGLSVRGTQALLDGLLGLELVLLEGGKYRNSPASSAFLVDGKPASISGLAKGVLSQFSRWSELPQVAKTGVPTAKETADLPENPFWESLVTSIAVLSFPLAEAAAERLSLAAAGPVSWLDVGGGSGVYSAVWLGKNREARAVQLDWKNVNAIARAFVAKFGVGDRFRTVDGDFHTTDFGQSRYEFAVYSHLAHQESPSSNREIFRRFRKALKPAGTLLVSDFVLDADRRGNPFSLMFTANMLLHSKEGSAYRETDYREWLQQAGFESVSFVPTAGAATLIYAR